MNSLVFNYTLVSVTKNKFGYTDIAGFIEQETGKSNTKLQDYKIKHNLDYQIIKCMDHVSTDLVLLRQFLGQNKVRPDAVHLKKQNRIGT